MRVPIQQWAGTTKQITLLYAERINMLDGLSNDEVDQYLEEHPKIVSLFEVEVVEVITPYVTHR